MLLGAVYIAPIFITFFKYCNIRKLFSRNFLKSIDKIICR